VLIEINLAPGAAAKLGPRRMPALSLPALPSLGGVWRTFGGAALGLLVVGIVLFAYWRMGTQQAELTTRIQQEVTDSARFATTIGLLGSLQARQDTITQKIGVIRAVDDRRYVWPHLLDEIGLAVPAYTWLTEISSTEVADTLRSGPVFTIQGHAGSTPALTRFMKNLEESPFIRGVTLITTEQEELEGRTIQRFSLEARYREPDLALIRTVPIIVLD
jgi:Tfp pilus assembly protein PilN